MHIKYTQVSSKRPNELEALTVTSRNRERTGRISYQGVAGANSDMACQAAYPNMEPVACESFEDAFAAVESGDADLGMIPIENSVGGRVADIHHLLPDSGLYIVDEHFQPVQHQLLGVPGATLESINTVESHVQALSQCRHVINELNLRPVQSADTAGAAKALAESGDTTTAAIASSLAAQVYGLNVLRSRIEDKIGNTTRFVVMSRVREEPDFRDGPCMTSIVFQVRSVPAALYKSLGGFATHGINITKLESYITDASFTVAQFYAELEGHPADRSVDQAFDELQYFSTKLKIIGTYPANEFRNKM
ncbi:MAG: prephenate dehydratase [Chromatiales bacterium]|jgi:prephenate dehydratase|nr:prephenate dehydratase [Chromatiales bacterium]